MNGKGWPFAVVICGSVLLTVHGSNDLIMVYRLMGYRLMVHRLMVNRLMVNRLMVHRRNWRRSVHYRGSNPDLMGQAVAAVIGSLLLGLGHRNRRPVHYFALCSVGPVLCCHTCAVVSVILVMVHRV
jgi:hypothetical protein